MGRVICTNGGRVSGQGDNEMTIKVYQFDLTDAEYDLLNEKGWGKAEAQQPSPPPGRLS